jgi:hypothetical protein
LVALSNPDVSCGGSLVDYFLFLHYAAFGEDYRVNREWARVRNRASAGEAVSAMISKSAATQFLVTIIESTGITESKGIITESTRTVAHRKPSSNWGSGFVDNFQVGSDSVFGDDYRVNRDCAHRQNQASAGEAVLVTISSWKRLIVGDDFGVNWVCLC